eukprot:1856869-Pleurochrysis_carterae.AAC.3
MDVSDVGLAGRQSLHLIGRTSCSDSKGLCKDMAAAPGSKAPARRTTEIPADHMTAAQISGLGAQKVCAELLVRAALAQMWGLRAL